jgi:hypothetical protein
METGWLLSNRNSVPSLSPETWEQSSFRNGPAKCAKTQAGVDVGFFLLERDLRG